MSTPEEEKSAASPKAVLVSTGGAPGPVIAILQATRPAQVWYFCSPDSRKTADEIHRALDWHPDRDFIEVERYEELGPCYISLRKAIPDLLARWKVAPDEVMVDYTGGTKTMSAALVLAATECFSRFSYVGGHQRERGGVGVVVEGKEKIHYQTNPWNELAVREAGRVADFWNHGLFEAAASLLRDCAKRVPRPRLFAALADLAAGLAARNRLDFARAEQLCGKAANALDLLLDGSLGHPLPVLARGAQGLCTACKEGGGPVLLRELLDNALRTATQGRYEDAAARLYRAMEMQGQLWLAEATGGAFLNGKLREGRPLPGALADWDACRPDRRGDVRLSLELCFQALARLDHAQARIVAEDLARGNPGSRWRQATEKRNTSVLAHGTTPIGAEGFEKMKAIASEFLGFDLDVQANPVPPFEAGWIDG